MNLSSTGQKKSYFDNLRNDEYQTHFIFVLLFAQSFNSVCYQQVVDGLYSALCAHSVSVNMLRSYFHDMIQTNVDFKNHTSFCNKKTKKQKQMCTLYMCAP